MGDLPKWKMQRFFRDFFKMVKNTEIFQSGENTKIFQSGLIVMGDLPIWKIQRFLKVMKNAKV